MNKRINSICLIFGMVVAGYTLACRTGSDWRRDDTLFVRKETRRPAPDQPRQPSQKAPTPTPTPVRPQPTPPVQTVPKSLPTQPPAVQRSLPPPPRATPMPQQTPRAVTSIPASTSVSTQKRQALQAQAQAIEQRLALNPNQLSERKALGNVYASLDRHRLAYDQYRQAYNLGAPTFDLCMNLAKSQALAFDPAGAIKIFQEACRKIPPGNEAEKSKGQLLESFLLWKSGRDVEGAIKTLKNRILNSPNDAQAYALLGQIVLSRNQPGLAKTYFTKALEFYEGQKPIEVLHGLRRAHEALGDVEEAKVLQQEILQLNPDDVGILTKKGLEALRAQDHGRAQVIFKQLTQIEPFVSEHFLNLGVAYRQSGQFDLAEIEYLRTLKVKPDDAGALFNLGLIYMRGKKDPLKAIYFFQKIASVDPTLYQSKKVKDLVDQARRDAERGVSKGVKR